MSRPRREHLWISGLSGEQRGVIAQNILTLYHDERIDQSETLHFEIPADHPKASLLIPDAEIRWRSRRFYVDELEAGRDGSKVTTTVTANALWYRLADVTRVGSVLLERVAPSEGLGQILTGSGWHVGGSSTLSGDLFSMEEQDRTILSLIRSWARVTGRSAVFDTTGRSVALVDQRGADRGLAFRYGRNLSRVRRRFQAPAVTVLYAYGADGLNVAGVNGGREFVEDFSYYTEHPTDPVPLPVARERFTRSVVWHDDRFLVDTNLLAAAQKRLARLAKAGATYELKVADLSGLTDIAEDLDVADRVRVADPDFVEDLRTTVARLKRHPLEPWRNEVELAGIPNPLDSGTSGRPASSAEWRQFVGPIKGAYQIRNDGSFIVARIGLNFREGGRANYHLDLHATGVGAGTMHVEIIDAANAVTVFKTLDVEYVDGEAVRAHLSWAAEELSGSYDYRVRVTTTATGGPSGTLGVDIDQDADGEASWWVLAQGAVQQTPTSPNTTRIDWNGTIEVPGSGSLQTFTVPDGVTTLEVSVAGSRGGGLRSPPSSPTAAGAGPGGIVSFVLPVTPGEVLNVAAGGPGGDEPSGGAKSSDGGWPNGGAGVSGGRGGGGASWISRSTFAAAIAVAGAGGGHADAGVSRSYSVGGGGRGGFFEGGPGGDINVSRPLSGGQGATADAGGIGGFLSGGTPSNAPSGETGGAGTGGAGQVILAGGGPFGPGGGGGGRNGGGGAAGVSLVGGGNFGGDGGGGAGSLDPDADAYDIEFSDGGNNTPGYVEFRWETPES